MPLHTTQMMVKSLEDGRPNGLVEELGAPYMEMLLDMLIHPEGPRLRDRISHGEVLKIYSVAYCLVMICRSMFISCLLPWQVM